MTARGLPEWVKNLLIAALSLSALYLFTLSPLYLNSPLQGWTTRLLSRSEASVPVSVTQISDIRPERIAVTGQDGRYGIEYDSAAVDSAFSHVGGLLGEALSSATEPISITEDRWQRALSEVGVYFDFYGHIPLSALAGWLSNGTANQAISASARRMALSAGDDSKTVWLFYQDADTAAFYACPTALSVTDHLIPPLTSFSPNSAFFAFELEAYHQCSPYTLILPDTPAPPVYTSAMPISAASQTNLSAVLSALSFSTQATTAYTVNDGTVYKDGDDTLRLSSNGTLIYYSSDVPRYFVSAEGTSPTVGAAIEYTQRLANATLGSFCGEARLALLEAKQSGSDWIITYDYRLDGVPVRLYEEGWAAQFIVSGNAVTQFTLHFRNYTELTDLTSLLLPPLQAAAAMSALGHSQSELLLTYLDSGADSVSAGWIAGNT